MNETLVENFEEIIYALMTLGLAWLFWFRANEIGSMTGYFVRFHQVDKQTPGCLLKPFGVLFFLAFCALVLGILQRLFSG
jgi:hypothetical protein